MVFGDRLLYTYCHISAKTVLPETFGTSSYLWNINITETLSVDMTVPIVKSKR